MRILGLALATTVAITAVAITSCTTPSGPAPHSSLSRSPLRALGSEPATIEETRAPIPPESYLGQLLDAYEFIDFWDILAAIRDGDAHPWTRYDEPGKPSQLDTWRRARAVALADPAHPELTSLDILHRIISASDEPFRDHPVIGGGDEQVDGPEIQGFYIVTESQKLALEKNPLLSLTLRTGPKAVDGSQLWYAKHEYPSARTYRRVSALLSPELVAELAAADRKGALAEETSPEFKRLTHKMVDFLVRTALADTSGPASERYQRLMSIHPYSDFNGRTLRMWYARQTGKPLFLKIWDWDLFMQPAEFAQAIAQGDSDLAELRKGFLVQRDRDPGFPKYFDSDAPWQVATGLSPSDPRRARAREALHPLLQPGSTLREAIRHKSHLDVLSIVQKALNNLQN